MQVLVLVHVQGKKNIIQIIDKMKLWECSGDIMLPAEFNLQGIWRSSFGFVTLDATEVFEVLHLNQSEGIYEEFEMKVTEVDSGK